MTPSAEALRAMERAAARRPAAWWACSAPERPLDADVVFHVDAYCAGCHLVLVAARARHAAPGAVHLLLPLLEELAA